MFSDSNKFETEKLLKDRQHLKIVPGNQNYNTYLGSWDKNQLISNLSYEDVSETKNRNLVSEKSVLPYIPCLTHDRFSICKDRDDVDARWDTNNGNPTINYNPEPKINYSDVETRMNSNFEIERNKHISVSCQTDRIKTQNSAIDKNRSFKSNVNIRGQFPTGGIRKSFRHKSMHACLLNRHSDVMKWNGKVYCSTPKSRKHMSALNSGCHGNRFPRNNLNMHYVTRHPYHDLNKKTVIKDQKLCKSDQDVNIIPCKFALKHKMDTLKHNTDSNLKNLSYKGHNIGCSTTVSLTHQSDHNTTEEEVQYIQTSSFLNKKQASSFNVDDLKVSYLENEDIPMQCINMGIRNCEVRNEFQFSNQPQVINTNENNKETIVETDGKLKRSPSIEIIYEKPAGDDQHRYDQKFSSTNNSEKFHQYINNSYTKNESTNRNFSITQDKGNDILLCNKATKTFQNAKATELNYSNTSHMQTIPNNYEILNSARICDSNTCEVCTTGNLYSKIKSNVYGEQHSPQQYNAKIVDEFYASNFRYDEKVKSINVNSNCSTPIRFHSYAQRDTEMNFDAKHCKGVCKDSPESMKLNSNSKTEKLLHNRITCEASYTKSHENYSNIKNLNIVNDFCQKMDEEMLKKQNLNCSKLPLKIPQIGVENNKWNKLSLSQLNNAQYLNRHFTNNYGHPVMRQSFVNPVQLSNSAHQLISERIYAEKNVDHIIDNLARQHEVNKQSLKTEINQSFHRTDELTQNIGIKDIPAEIVNHYQKLNLKNSLHFNKEQTVKVGDFFKTGMGNGDMKNNVKQSLSEENIKYADRILSNNSDKKKISAPQTIVKVNISNGEIQLSPEISVFRIPNYETAPSVQFNLKAKNITLAVNGAENYQLSGQNDLVTDKEKKTELQKISSEVQVQNTEHLTPNEKKTMKTYSCLTPIVNIKNKSTEGIINTCDNDDETNHFMDDSKRKLKNMARKVSKKSKSCKSPTGCRNLSKPIRDIKASEKFDDDLIKWKTEILQEIKSIRKLRLKTWLQLRFPQEVKENDFRRRIEEDSFEALLSHVQKGIFK